MLRRRMLFFFLAVFFTCSSLCGVALAAETTVSGNLIGTSWILTVNNPKLTGVYQSGNSTVSSSAFFGQNHTLYFYTNSVNVSSYYPMLNTVGIAGGNNYQWQTEASRPFPSLAVGSSILVYPRFVNEVPLPSLSPSISPHSLVFTVPPPSTDYRGLSINFSKIRHSLVLSAPEGTPSYTGNLQDVYVSIVINGKTWSTVRYDGSTASPGLNTRVTLDVTPKDTVNVIFSIYPPVVFQSTQSKSFRLYYSSNMQGIYSKPAFPLSTSPYTYPLQYCWYNLSNTPTFDDGFEGGIPGDYQPGSGSGSGSGSDNSEQLKEIQDSLASLGTDLESYTKQVEQLATDVNSGLDKVDQSIKDSTDTIMGDDSDPDNPTGIKGIIATIKNLPKMFLDGLVHLFVPTDEDIEEVRQAYEDMFASRLGFVAQVGTSIGDLFGGIHDLMVANLADDEYTFDFPGISFPVNGETVTIAEPSKVSLNNKFFFAVRSACTPIFIIISVLAVINTAQRLFEAIFITETGKYFWRGGSD